LQELALYHKDRTVQDKWAGRIIKGLLIALIFAAWYKSCGGPVVLRSDPDHPSTSI
jgi:hypothetical protein